jgi:FkbM family methyltransferase
MKEVNQYNSVPSGKTKLFNLFRKLFILTSFDKVLASLPRNKTMDFIVSKICPPNYLYKKGSIRNFTVNGINYSLDISDAMGHTIYFAIYDPAHSLLIKKIKKGMTIFDVGANIGSTTLNFAKKVGSDGKVFSFEPDPLNYSIALKNISLNKFSCITLFNLGLGSIKETASLYNVNENNRGMLRILDKAGEPNNFSKSTIEIYTIDQIMTEKKISRPDIIKIDVEGYELRVLKGAEKTLKEYMPILFIELDDNNLREQKSSALALIQYVRSLGYVIVDASKDLLINEFTNFKNCHIDIICTA